MKKLLLLFISLSSVTLCQAQGLSLTDDKLDEMVLAVNLSGAEMLTKELAQELHLDTEQSAQVEELSRERFKQLEEAETKYASNPEMLDKMRQTVILKSDKALETVLTEPQLRIFMQLEAKPVPVLISENDKE